MAALEALEMNGAIDLNTMRPVEQAYGRLFQAACDKEIEIRNESQVAPADARFGPLELLLRSI